MKVSMADAQSMVEREIKENGYDLNKYLPQGFIPTMMVKTGRKKSTINVCLSNIRKQADIRIKQTKLTPEVPAPNSAHTGTSKIIEEYLKTSEYNINKRLPYGALQSIADDFGMEKVKVKNAIQVIKVRTGLRVQKSTTVKKPDTNNLVDVFSQFNVERQAPNQNRISSDRILKSLVYELPKGGGGLMIGTPTPFAVSPQVNNNLLLTDELDIAVVLRTTCDHHPTIVVGDLISPEKAKIKGQFWRNINSTNNFNVTVGHVDRDSYTHYITKLAEEHSLLKVILITSGVWSCSAPSRRKYGHDFNFKSPSIYLTSIYPNLHILAMVMHGNRFKIHHLHDRKENILE